MGGTKFPPGGPPPSADRQPWPPHCRINSVKPQKNLAHATYPHPDLTSFQQNSRHFNYDRVPCHHLGTSCHVRDWGFTAALSSSPPCASVQPDQGRSQGYVGQLTPIYPRSHLLPGLQSYSYSGTMMPAVLNIPPTHPHPFVYTSTTMPGYVVFPAADPGFVPSHVCNVKSVYQPDNTNFNYNMNIGVAPHTSISYSRPCNSQSSFGSHFYQVKSQFTDQHPQFNSITQVQEPVADRKLNQLQKAAHEYVLTALPQLGSQPYCLPSLKRSRHPDKSIKQLAVGMESEKRVLGSFQRFLAKEKLPVLMLCHYPISGFMQVYQQEGGDFYSLQVSSRSKGGRDTLTLLLLSDIFCVTVVTVSIISGNSDFAYIQRGVHKAAGHIKKCSNTVSEWLTFLGLTPEVRQVIAFPNLKRAMMQRLTKDKHFQQNFGSVCCLHVDDLSAPFEEEWSTAQQMHLFSDWMRHNILCHKPTLSLDDLSLVVGALLSPRLSKVEFVEDDNQEIPPISESQTPAPESDSVLEDVGQLLLTIDGVTQSFGDFMDQYVSSYFPRMEEQTYRVPPIHFNIQAFKKPAEFLENGVIVFKNVKNKQELKNGVNNLCGHGSVQLCYFFRISASRNGNVVSLDPGESDFQQCNQEIRTQKEKLPAAVFLEPAKEEPSQCSANNIHISSNQSSDSNPELVISFPSCQTATADSGLTISHSSSEGKLSMRDCVGGHLPHLEFLSDVEILSDVMTKDMRADEGENRVISALEKLGQRFGPVFIICDYQYNNYLNKLREEMFLKGESKRPIRAFGQTMRAQHDCLILHKKYGVIIVCIKAIGDNFQDWGASEEQKINSTNKILEKAVKQLERETTMIQRVTSDLQPQLICHNLIALPNLTREHVRKALEADDKMMKKVQEVLGHGADLILCADELPPKFQSVWDYQYKDGWTKLISWWCRVEQQLKANGAEMSAKQYRQIVGRYCGLLSTVEVWSQSNPRVEVRSLSEAISECAKRFSKLRLLPEQLEVLCSPDKRVFLCGPPGCGKTLLLTLKAREWLLEGHKVILVNARPGSALGYPYAYGVFTRLQQMMFQSQVTNYQLLMISEDSLNPRFKTLAGIMPSCYIICDEVSTTSHQIIEHLSCLPVQKIWCAGLAEEDKPETAHNFMTHTLHKIIRCPPLVQSVMKQTESDVKLRTSSRDICVNQPVDRTTQDTEHKSFTLVEDMNNYKRDVEFLQENLFFNNQKNCMNHSALIRSSLKTSLDENIISLLNETSSTKEKKLHLNAVADTPESLDERLRKKYPPSQIKKLHLKVNAVADTPESLDERLLKKYPPNSQKSQTPTESVPPGGIFEPSTYCNSSAEMGLPTDGPQILIVDHRSHPRAISPRNCSMCGSMLADLLLSLVRPDSLGSASSKSQGQSRNKPTSKREGNKYRVLKPGDSSTMTSANVSSSTPSTTSQSSEAVFESRKLEWSDVLIVANEMSSNSDFVLALNERKIPVEVLMTGRTFVMEERKHRKLFITQYQEIRGMERAVIVFVPSQASDQLSQEGGEDLDLAGFTTQDRSHLWYAASRSLAALVLILP